MLFRSMQAACRPHAGRMQAACMFWYVACAGLQRAVLRTSGQMAPTGGRVLLVCAPPREKQRVDAQHD